MKCLEISSSFKLTEKQCKDDIIRVGFRREELALRMKYMTHLEVKLLELELKVNDKIISDIDDIETVHRKYVELLRNNSEF